MPLHEEPIHSLHVTSPSLSSVTELPEKYVLRLTRAGLTTVSEVILTAPDSLKSQTGLSSEEVEEVYQRLSEACSPKTCTISQRINDGDGAKRSCISLGTASLDRLFGDNGSDSQDGDGDGDDLSTRGVPTGLITEIAGESACGKTCMCLQLSLNVQLGHALGGLQGGCIYLCTESAFPSSRLYEMAAGLCERWRRNSSSLGGRTREAIDSLDAEALMQNVHLLRAQDPQALIHSIHYSLPAFLEKHNTRKDRNDQTKTQDGRNSDPKPIRLIVLDSIGAIFRADVEQNKLESSRGTKHRMTERASEMNQVADGLKFLAHQYQLAVVIVNQVSDVIDSAARWTADPSRPSDTQIGEGTTLPDDRTDGPNSSHPHPPPSSSSRSSATPDSLGTLTPSTPTTHECPDRLGVPLYYHQQARHFTGQKATHNRKEAALGLAWTNAINIRIMLNKVYGSYAPHPPPSNPSPTPIPSIPPHPAIKKTSLTVREAVVVFSPLGKTASHSALEPSIQFVITSHGIVSLHDLPRHFSCS